jgi:nicotinamide mononucleotide transporter
MSWDEPLAVALALAYVVFAIKEKRIAWVLAAASAALYLRIFFVVGLVMEASLQVFYILMAVYGWIAWGRDHSKIQLPIQRWPARLHVMLLGGVLLLGSVLGLLISQLTDASLPIVDSITTLAALLATWMVARKVLENWLWWIGIDVVSIVLFLNRGLDLTALLFAGYVVLAAAGWLSWRQHYRAQAQCE